MDGAQPADRNERYTVVRVGTVIVTFTKLNVGGSAKFPADLVSRQVERLRAAQHLQP
jgi:hypothetical protein